MASCARIISCVLILSLTGLAAAQTALPGKAAQEPAAQGKSAQPQGGLPAQAPAGATEPDPIALTLKRARDLRAAKKWEEALAVTEKGLERVPRDLQMRFLKGLILTDQNKPDAAIPVFEALTQDYPELGEPYNNLAVLLAGKGELDRARALLERAVQAQPNYALAYENLGDVHLRLAERSYQDAVAKNPALKGAKAKLDQAREWVKSTENKP